MHLLHCYYDTSSNSNSLSISIEECFGRPPPYAILSHRWAVEPGSEVTFEDMTLRHESAKRKRGYGKITGCCVQALKDGYSWVWIDTCCINKGSSAELTEAINSMYSWYEKAQVCYAYLEDVNSPDDQPAFVASSWFQRGWTLQELIAPAEVEFFSSDWQRIGNKIELSYTLSEITKVNELILMEGLHVYKASIAEKMSWAAQRTTTRVEDRAYSLMGIFGVTMPPLYGEGSRAFMRLQHEIMRMSNDHTIFTWQRKSLTAGLLAESPEEFAESDIWRPLSYQSFVTRFAIQDPKPDFIPTNFGMHIQLPLASIPGFRGYYFAFLACTSNPEPGVDLAASSRVSTTRSGSKLPAIFLRQIPGEFSRQFIRTSLQNRMMGYGNPDEYKCELEPIWVSLKNDITPLAWKPWLGQLPPPLDIPFDMEKTDGAATIIMERRHRYLQIVSAYPPEAFSNSNELSLSVAPTAAETLRVMVIQNERGRDSVAIIFFVVERDLCLACHQIVANEDAGAVYNRLLTEGTTFRGFLSIPFNTPEESSMCHCGFLTSLECLNIGTPTYRFTIGPAHRDGSGPMGNIARGFALQINIHFPVLSEFFKYKPTKEARWQLGEMLKAFCSLEYDQKIHKHTPGSEKRVELLGRMWDTLGDARHDYF